MYATLLFDFFGVIRADAYTIWLNRHGFRREGDFEDVVKQLDTGLISWRQCLEFLSQQSGDTVAAVAAELDAIAQLDPAMVELLANLHHDYQLGLVSNASATMLRPLLTETSLEQHFDAVIISSEVGSAKPDAEIFEHALAKLGAKPAETIFIDDSPANTDAANQQGIHGLLYTDITRLKADLAQLGIQF